MLTEAIARGNQVDATTFELPMVITTKIERRDTDDSFKICTHQSISVLGSEIIGWDSCETVTAG